MPILDYRTRNLRALQKKKRAKLQNDLACRLFGVQASYLAVMMRWPPLPKMDPKPSRNAKRNAPKHSRWRLRQKG